MARLQTHNYGDWDSTKPSLPTYKQEVLNLTRYDVLNMSRAGLARMNEYKTPFHQMLEVLRSRNPNKRILWYLSIQSKPIEDRDWGAFGTPDYAARYQRTCPISWADIEMNDWWLYNAAGEIARETPSIWMLDIGKPGLKEAFAEAVEANWIDGYDGTVLDYQNCPSRKYVHDAGMRDYADDRDWWERAYVPFVEHVFPRLRARGMVIGNCMGWHGAERHPFSKDTHQRKFIDGVIQESTFWGLAGERLPAAEIERRMAAMQADPLIVLQTDLLGDVWDERVRANRMTISIAGHLLAMPGGDTSGAYLRTKRYVHVATDQRPRWDNRYNLDLGEPTSSRECPAEGVWRRYYSNGLVVMNYSMVPWVTNLRGRWCDLGGVGVGGSTTIAPESALILRRV